MVGLQFKSGGLAGTQMAAMKEALKLRIDETGAKVESAGMMMGITSIDMDPPR